MFRPLRPLVPAFGGLGVGALIVASLILVGAFGKAQAPVTRPDASVEFIDAFRRSLTAAYVVRADYTRVLDGGSKLESATFIAQRPPDRIQREFGGVSGSIAGRQIMCSTASDGKFHCGPAAVAPDPASVLADQVRNLRSYFVSPPLYRVAKGGPGCFDLTQVRFLSLAPYGSSATMCFDRATGAIRYLRQHLEGAMDTFIAVEIRSFVTDQDFSLAQDRAYDSTSSGKPADAGVPPNGTSVPTSQAPALGTTTPPRG